MRNLLGLVMALLAGVVLFEVPGLVRRKMWRELLVFSIYLALGAGLTIPQALGIRLPNPTKTIEAVFGPLARLLK